MLHDPRPVPRPVRAIPSRPTRRARRPRVSDPARDLFGPGGKGAAASSARAAAAPGRLGLRGDARGRRARGRLHRLRHRGAGGAGARPAPARHVYRRHRRAGAAPPLRRGDRQLDGRGGRRPCQLHRGGTGGIRRPRWSPTTAAASRSTRTRNSPASRRSRSSLTTLHAGGKFDSKVYETSGGLHGVGISVVNALSDLLEVEVARNQTLYRQTFSRGHAQGACWSWSAGCRTGAAPGSVSTRTPRSSAR